MELLRRTSGDSEAAAGRRLNPWRPTVPLRPPFSTASYPTIKTLLAKRSKRLSEGRRRKRSGCRLEDPRDAISTKPFPCNEEIDRSRCQLRVAKVQLANWDIVGGAHNLGDERADETLVARAVLWSDESHSHSSSVVGQPTVDCYPRCLEAHELTWSAVKEHCRGCVVVKPTAEFRLLDPIGIGNDDLDHRSDPETSPTVRGPRCSILSLLWAEASPRGWTAGPVWKPTSHSMEAFCYRKMERCAAQQMTGHKTRVVFDRYHIVAPGDLQRAAALMDAKLAADRASRAAGHNSGTVTALASSTASESRLQVGE